MTYIALSSALLSVKLSGLPLVRRKVGSEVGSSRRATVYHRVLHNQEAYLQVFESIFAILVSTAVPLFAAHLFVRFHLPSSPVSETVASTASTTTALAKEGRFASGTAAFKVVVHVMSEEGTRRSIGVRRRRRRRRRGRTARMMAFEWPVARWTSTPGTSTVRVMMMRREEGRRGTMVRRAVMVGKVTGETTAKTSSEFLSQPFRLGRFLLLLLVLVASLSIARFILVLTVVASRRSFDVLMSESFGLGDERVESGECLAVAWLS